MSELKIPSLNKKSDKYLFKNKFPLKRKSKTRLLSESFFMLISSLILFYLNYLIPNKSFLFKNFSSNFQNSFILIIDILSYLFQILLVIFIIISLILALILFLGSFYRLVKVFKRRTKQTSYK